MGSRILVYGSRALSFSLCSFRIVSGLDTTGGSGVRWQVLKQVDEELRKGNERGALDLVKDLQAKPAGLRCFGAARQIPQKLYTLDELRLNGIEASSLLAPVDTTLGSIQRSIQAGLVFGGIAAWNFFGLTPEKILFTSLGFLFLWTLDALDKLLKSLGFTQKKADAQVRWAVLNTILILRRHEKARAMLTTGMSQGLSVGFCIDIIEQAIDVGEV